MLVFSVIQALSITESFDKLTGSELINQETEFMFTINWFTSKWDALLTNITFTDVR